MTNVQLPIDANYKEIPLVPSKISLATTYDTTISTSTQISLNPSTSLIEVSALSQAILMKWGLTAVTTSNFDNVIQAGSTRHFVIPVDTATGILFTAVNFIEQSASATLMASEF